MTYYPYFWTPQVSGGEGASDELIQSLTRVDTAAAVAALDLPPAPTDLVPVDYTADDVNRPVPPQSSNYSTYDAADPWQNWEYFHQYGKLTIHNEMLKDTYRTDSYRDAILNHAADFKGKVVLDIGTGTGILSFFAARAGASKVYAVEASGLAEWTELAVAANNLGDTIKVIKARVEDLVLPEKVDIIISEWMGTFLIFESMLESVLYARDNLLKEDGMMFPADASIFLCPLTMDKFYQEKVDFWRNVYDVDMSVIMPFAKKCAFEKPIIDHQLQPENMLAEPIKLKEFDLRHVPVAEPYEKTVMNFNFSAKKDGNLHGFGGWFDVLFRNNDPNDSNKVNLSTSPNQKSTHWHQMLMMFDDPVSVKEGQSIKGTIRYQRNPDLLRHLIFDLSFSVDNSTRSYSKRFYLWGTE